MTFVDDASFNFQAKPSPQLSTEGKIVLAWSLAYKIIISELKWVIQKSPGDHLRGPILLAGPQPDPVILDKGWLVSGPSILVSVIYVKQHIIIVYTKYGSITKQLFCWHVIRSQPKNIEISSIKRYSLHLKAMVFYLQTVIW
jgi:hypothetical protein